MYTLQVVDLAAIQFNPHQPRRNAADTDIASLAASMDGGLAQLPVVFPQTDGSFLIQAGERRIRAAQLRGDQTMQMMVLDPTMPLISRHRLSLVENLHRRELNLIDRALGFKLFHLMLNAEAVGLTTVQQILLDAPNQVQALHAMQAALEAHGWHHLKPAVTYADVLKTLGITINRSELMRELQVLNLDVAVLERMQQLPNLSEAVLRAFGKLSSDDQRILIAALEADPTIQRSIRRICDKAAKGVYTIREAIAEAQGTVYFEPFDAPDSAEIMAETAADPSVTGEADESMVMLPSARSGSTAPPVREHTTQNVQMEPQAHSSEQPQPVPPTVDDLVIDIEIAALECMAVTDQLREQLTKLREILGSYRLMDVYREYFLDQQAQFRTLMTFE